MNKTQQIIAAARAEPGKLSNIDLCTRFLASSTFVSRIATEHSLDLKLAAKHPGKDAGVSRRLTIRLPRDGQVTETLRKHADTRKVHLTTLAARIIEVAARENIIDAILDDGAGANSRGAR